MDILNTILFSDNVVSSTVRISRVGCCDCQPHSSLPSRSRIRPRPLSPRFLILVALGDLVALSLWEWRVVAVFVVFKVLCDVVIVI